MDWLERLEGFGGAMLDVGAEVAAEKARQSIKPKNPDKPADQPERQADTKIETSVEPIPGPVPNVGAAVKNTVAQYKWWVVGGLGFVAFMAIKGAR